MATIYLASARDRYGIEELARREGLDLTAFEKEMNITLLHKPDGYLKGLADIADDSNVRTVMLIDDEPSFHAMAKAYFDGRTVHAYANPRKAVDDYKNGKLRPDVVITDLQMPEMDGFDVIKAIRELEGK